MSKLPWTPTQKSEEEIYDDRSWKIVEQTNEPWYTIEEFRGQPLYFWIDTICVPLRPHTTKFKAITSMNSVYSRANRVLVFDAELYTQEVLPLAGQELEIRPDICARIMASTWMKRYWTMQEAALARIVWYQFAGDACRLAPDYDLDRGQFEAVYDSQVRYYVHERTFRTWMPQTSISTPTTRMAHVLAALRGRAASVETDIPLCIAILLDLDLETLKIPEDRVPSLWRMLKEFPAGILCYPTQRCKEPDLRWAPNSFHQFDNLGPPMTHPAYITPEGVSLTLHGFTFKIEESLPRQLVRVSINGQDYFVRHSLVYNNESWENIDFNKHSWLGVLFGQAPVHDPRARLAFTAGLGTLLSIQKEEGKRLRVVYLRAISIIKKGCIHDTYPLRPYTEIELEERRRPAIEACLTPMDQNWLIVPSNE